MEHCIKMAFGINITLLVHLSTTDVRPASAKEFVSW